MEFKKMLVDDLIVETVDIEMEEIINEYNVLGKMWPGGQITDHLIFIYNKLIPFVIDRLTKLERRTK